MKIRCIIINDGVNQLWFAMPTLTSGLADFIPITNEVVTFQPREMEQFVNFTTLSDNIVEGTEMLTAVLSNPSTRAMIGQQDTAMINITDDAGKLSREAKENENWESIL